MKHGFMIAALAAVSVASVAPAVRAQDVCDKWPSKPVTLVHPSAAGSDAIARMVAKALEDRIGQQVIVENRAGAGGAIGTGYVAKQAPDGYTLVTAYPGAAANFKNTMPSLPYDPIEDFTHIMQLTSGAMVMMTRADFPADDLKGLVAYAKANPGKVSAANNGIGSYGHMGQLTFADQAGIQLNFVPYKGSNLIVQDLLSGSVDISFDYFGSAYAKQVQSGKIKALASATDKRLAQFANVPTFVEQGFNFTAAPWGGLMAPKGTPRCIVDKINAALTNYLTTDQKAIETLESLAAPAAPSSPEAFHEMVVNEERKWRDTIKKYDIRNE